MIPYFDGFLYFYHFKGKNAEGPFQTFFLLRMKVKCPLMQNRAFSTESSCFWCHFYSPNFNGFGQMAYKPLKKTHNRRKIAQNRFSVFLASWTDNTCPASQVTIDIKSRNVCYCSVCNLQATIFVFSLCLPSLHAPFSVRQTSSSFFIFTEEEYSSEVGIVHHNFQWTKLFNMPTLFQSFELH